jgi:lysophospholipid acyltransferase (LPLAT)-like uncharacterized protein
VAVEARRGFRLGTWDGTLIPWPFSRVEIRLGKPLRPDSMEGIGRAMRMTGTNPGRSAVSPEATRA